VPPLACKLTEYAVPVVPPGRSVVATDTGGGAIDMDSARVALWEAASVTRTVKLAAPWLVGVPPIAPLDARARPAGSEPPPTVHVNGGVPPLACKLTEYAVPLIPAGRSVVVIETGGGAIKIDSARVALRNAASLTRTVKFAVPGIVGVPLIAPFAASAKPEGSDPPTTFHVYGVVPPFACKTAPYEAPAVPTGNSLVLTESVSGCTIMASGLVALSFSLSVTCTKNRHVPAAVGVPEMTPAELNISPVGSTAP
jgi:hypothetical protein